jgi:hypothetical protein
MRVAFYIVSAILVGVIVAGFIYTFNSRMQRIEHRRTSFLETSCVADRCVFQA